jgi:predicted DNA-binding transcriptional regulator YafY
MYGGEEQSVTIRCKNELAGVIIDRFGKDTVFTNLTDQSFEFHVKVAVSPTFLSWLMTFGSDMRIMSPESVKKAYIELASEGLDQYKIE